MGEPEPMSEKSIREARSVIDVFDIPLVVQVFLLCFIYSTLRLFHITKTMSRQKKFWKT